MWVLVFLFLLITLLISWTVFGYIILIWFMGLFHHRKTTEFPDSWPTISIMVPCYNEEEEILNKLEDIRRLDYPQDRLEVVFADGGSTDQTTSLLENSIRNHEPFRVITCTCPGKINQLNYILPQLSGEIIMNTDTDSRLAVDTLRWIAAEFESSPEVWVVGAYCRPDNTLDIDAYYWDMQNRARLMESDAQTSSIVIAQCYAFRKALLKSFPEDVVADDIYVTFLANTLGYRAVYSRHAKAVETRASQSYKEFFPHKFRKSNAFLRESLRFLYLLPEMNFFCKMMLTTRIAQQLFLPWAMLLWILVAGALLTLNRFDIFIMDLIFLLLLFLITNRLIYLVKLPDGVRQHSLKTIVKGYILTNLVMLSTGLSYPFFRQGSSYNRLENKGRE